MDMSVWEKAYRSNPDKLEYLRGYLRCARDIGDVKTCVELLEHALTLAPHHCGFELQLLWYLNYLPGYDRGDLFDRARQWAQRHVSDAYAYSAYPNCPSVHKKLRVGIVSGDFNENSPFTIVESSLQAIDRDQFALYAYSTVEAKDGAAERFKPLFRAFRDIHTLSDFELASQIRFDGIDILIVFGGRCKDNRLGVVAFKAAPVQVDWGALGSLGLRQIDYRITDAVMDPPEMQCYHVEELVYFPRGFATFCPPPASPPVTALPGQTNGYITFGSFNNHVKISDQVLDMWSEILTRVPEARLALKFPRADDPDVRKFVEQRLEQCGIDLGRIVFGGVNVYVEHLRCLGQVDLLLDCYPFNGNRTIMEGLWMGVPTVTLSGTTHVSRMGLGILKQVGLAATFVAQTPEAYINQACAWAARLGELAHVRSGLRARLLSSSLCDSRGFARDLEGALRTMWRRWCEKQDRDADAALAATALPGSDKHNRSDRGEPVCGSRLKSLLQGDAGLEISLDTAACPALLLEVNALLRSGRVAEAKAGLNEAALAVIDRYTADNPGRTDIVYVTAKLLSHTGQADKAEPLFLKVLEQESHPVVWADLAGLIEQGPARKSEAICYWRQACEMDPNNGDYLQAYARCARTIGEVSKSVQLLEKAKGLVPPEDDVIEGQLLWLMNYLPGYDRIDLFECAKQRAAKHANRICTCSSDANERSLTKKLKVGILSGDFLDNSPMTFFEPALSALNRETLELYAYSSVDAPDIGTARYEALFDVFRDIHRLSESEIAGQIRQDGIDILIAFGGQCHRNRLGVTALRPAAIQVDWGAPCTLGLPQIDYRLTDEILDPPAVQAYHTEQLVYVRGGFVTYRPPPESPGVTSGPAQSNGYVTFGSFNSHLKINELVLDLWVQILQRVPRARLLLKFQGAQDPGIRARLMQRFQRCGIDAERIQILTWMSYPEHLRRLGQTDLLLDCYPFNGFRTTLEGLWMGVPCITLMGTTFVSRMGLGIMKQLGLDAAFVAQTPQAYVDRACAYAGQLDALASIRSRLRELLLSSSICDPLRYARALEEAFRTMWRQRCERQGMQGKRQMICS